MSRIRELLERKRQDVNMQKVTHPLRVEDVPGDDRRIRWSKNRFHLITEIKRSSLSSGPIRPDLRITDLARSYERAGASAISVLTEQHYFEGSVEDLRAVRRAVSIPVLQKDFVIDAYQILEAKLDGADFVLLIARFLSPGQLTEFFDLCNSIRMNVLVEINTESDLAKLPGTVPFLGINSRDLETLQVDTSSLATLRRLLPDTFLIAESGISSASALNEVIHLGYNGALIGEHLLRAADPGEEAHQLVLVANHHGKGESETQPVRHGEPRPGLVRSTRVKICGITNERDALLAINAGADALGFIFAESPRRIDPEVLLQFRHSIPQGILVAGVFRGQPQHEVEQIMRQFSFDIAQVYDPMELPVPTWHAQILESSSDTALCADTTLIDLKLEGESLEAAWRGLAAKNVFALAGNLHPGNVAKAIVACRPQWVDVARGVEMSPGIKDEAKVRQFIKNSLSVHP